MNSIKNVTVPLTSNLNMNRNQSLTCSSFDIFNTINAPVFGGSISPLHYKIDYQGDAKYSVDGERWTMDSNKLYRGGLLFKDFSGEYTFDMHDTGLDLDSIVVNGNEFVGIKVASNRLDWSKINSDFQVIASGTLFTLGSDDSLGGTKLFVRNNTIYCLSGVTIQSSLDLSAGNNLLNLYRWNGSGFSLLDQHLFSFLRATGDSSFETIPKTYKKITPTTTWFFSVSKWFDNKFGITIFERRPNGTNTYKNVTFYNLLFNSENDESFQKIWLYSGYNQAIEVGVDGGSYESRENRQTPAYFVDNTEIVQSLGHVADTDDWTWVKMQQTFDTLTQSGSVEGFVKTWPSNNGHAAIYVEGANKDFAEINGGCSSCLTVNFNGYGRLVIAGYGSVASGDSTALSCPIVNTVFDSQLEDGLMNAGVTSNASLPTTKDGWSTWWKNRKVSDNTAWNPAGMRARIGDTNFYTLFNGKEGNAAGISYAVNSSHVGTLLTEWGSIVQTFENCATSDKVIFKDAKTNTVKYIQRRSNITLDDVEVVGKYLLVRCTADENIYDISSGKWAKFGNDWNNRMFLGYFNIVHTGDNIYMYLKTDAVNRYSSSWATSGSVAAGYDVAYVKEKGFSPSRLYAYNALSGIVLGEVNAFGYELTSENGLDIFASSGSSSPSYKCTLFGNGSSSSVSNMAGSVYPITSSGSAYFNIPIIGSEVVDSYNGKYGLKIDDSCYTIAYDGIRPVALYNTSSLVDQVDDFFIVQSQYYALIGGYICSLSYSSSNNISGVEQIVCADGMQFIGAFPACAYFYSPAARAIFAFTGDADLQLFVQTDRITEVYASKYYPNCEWIFMSTNDGIYVMSQNNTFRLKGDFGKVKRFFPTKDDYCVMVLEDGRNVFLSMTKKDGWTTIPVEIETAFFCDGDMKKSTITDWYIRVFKGDEDYNGKVTCSAKTMNDIVSQTIKTFDGKVDVKLTKDKFDENDNSMITLHTGCNALGTSCKVVSDYPIAYFGFTIGSDGSTAKSKYNI